MNTLIFLSGFLVGGMLVHIILMRLIIIPQLDLLKRGKNLMKEQLDLLKELVDVRTKEAETDLTVKENV